MGTLSSHLLVLGVAAGMLSACGSSGGIPGIVPTLGITSPANNSTVNLSQDKLVPVNFDTNYTLKAPGSCAGLPNCGHIFLLVDSTSCNAPSLPYNNLVVASPSNADLSKCMMATGMHTIRLELRRDDGIPVVNLLGNPLTSEVTITAQ